MKNVEEMTRFELLTELAAHVHPIAYPFVVSYSKPLLAALLAYHRCKPLGGVVSLIQSFA